MTTPYTGYFSVSWDADRGLAEYTAASRPSMTALQCSQYGGELRVCEDVEGNMREVSWQRAAGEGG